MAELRVRVVTASDDAAHSDVGFFGSARPAASYAGWSPRLVLGAESPGGLMLPSATPTASSLYAPRAVTLVPDTDGGVGLVIAADTGNHRLLIWHGLPATNGAPADVVLGQPDLTSEGPAAGGRGPENGFHLPTGVLVHEGRLVVADAWHHRVLVWDSVPTVHDTPPDHVLGQPVLGQRPKLLVAERRQVTANRLAFHAFVLAQMRDFEGAEPWLARAEKVAPSNVWVWVERAKVFELQDRFEDALSVLRYALMLQPWLRPTIQTSAHALVQAGRDDEALRLLAQATQHVECAWLVEQMANLQIELGQHEAARHSLERFAALSPRMEPGVLERLNAQRAEAAYLSGDHTAALAYAQQCQSPALRHFAAQLQRGPITGKRVVLPVGFVRQHHLTCAPATLATISRYYKMPAEHLRIAEEICTAGTSAYSERNWALKNGYAVREFRVTWENAQALLQRKIVFSLGTMVRRDRKKLVFIMSNFRPCLRASVSALTTFGVSMKPKVRITRFTSGM